jgi:hypothetical protein
MRISIRFIGMTKLNRNYFQPFKRFNALWLKVEQKEITKEKANVKIVLGDMPVMNH